MTIFIGLSADAKRGGRDSSVDEFLHVGLGERHVPQRHIVHPQPRVRARSGEAADLNLDADTVCTRRLIQRTCPLRGASAQCMDLENLTCKTLCA